MCCVCFGMISPDVLLPNAEVGQARWNKDTERLVVHLSKAVGRVRKNHLQMLTMAPNDMLQG